MKKTFSMKSRLKKKFQKMNNFKRGSNEPLLLCKNQVPSSNLGEGQGEFIWIKNMFWQEN